MSTELWDDTMGELAEMLGSAGVIHEAIPYPVAPGTILARSGPSWSVLSVRTIRDSRALLMAAGLLADVPLSPELYQDMAERTRTNTIGAYVALNPFGKDVAGLVFKTVVPYDLLGSTAGGPSQLARNIVSATVNAPDDLMPELSEQHGGRAFTFEDRGYLGNMVI